MYDTYDEIEEADIGQVESQKTWWAGYILFGVILLISCGWFYMFLQGVGLYHRVGINEFAIVQDVHGNYTVKEYGQYWRGFSRKVWIYQKTVDVRFEHIEATFCEGRTRGISGIVYIGLPEERKERIEFHKSFGNAENVKDLVQALVQTSVKYVAPSMTGKEVIGSHRREFAELAGGQVRDGFYISRRVDGETYRIEFIKDELGKYVVNKPSILKLFNLTMKQFSIINIDIPDEEMTKMQSEAYLRMLKEREEAKIKTAEALAKIATAFDSPE